MVDRGFADRSFGFASFAGSRWKKPSQTATRHPRHLCWWRGRPENTHFFGRTSHRHSAFLCIFTTYVSVSRSWGGVGWGRVG